ncbi:hypothetical protein OG613_44760 (plasmid) [Streptomyces sp. NBC_00015]|uniref:hypothetical protein n=1 Tax=Streptomyces sp. NBC_00015 TaxID=2903611 RepID=UPI002F916231
MTSDHDSTPQPLPADNGVLRIRIDPAPILGAVKLRVAPELAPELLAVLQEQGAEASYAAEFSIDPAAQSIISVAIASGTAWATLRTAINAFANRNKNKELHVNYGGEQSVSIKGSSKRDAAALFAKAQESFEAVAAQQRRQMSGGDGDDAAG